MYKSSRDMLANSRPITTLYKSSRDNPAVFVYVFLTLETRLVVVFLFLLDKVRDVAFIHAFEFFYSTTSTIINSG